jgi:class 3 adenylate cyclase
MDLEQARPSGTVTFLFTDVEGSTRLWQTQPTAMRGILARHDELVRGAIAESGGWVFSTAGDSFVAVFARAGDAIAAALRAQTALQSEPWPAGVDLRVRMGVHTGEADERGGDYFGPAVNRAARVMAAAHGGQVLVSLAAEEIVGDQLPPGARLQPVGEVELRGFDRGERAVQLCSDALKLSTFPPPVGVAGRPGNLPVPATSFCGREPEVDALGAMLAQLRLVTLVGPGGVGKTRLAIEAAGRCAGRFPDGIWFCELAPVVEGSGVVHTIAYAIGSSLREGRNHTEQLVGSLRGKHALLVLDNCEHLLDDVVAVVVPLLAGWAEGTVLCTSREGLGVVGEQLFPVGGLGAAGVSLFLDRARALVPDFQADDDGIGAIQTICRRVDEIPLAIELAAARVRTLTPQEIAARLADRFRLLRGRAVVGWSGIRPCTTRSAGPMTCSARRSNVCSSGGRCSPASSNSSWGD